MRAAIVGAGLMGRWHADAVSRLGIPIVAVVDTQLGAAEILAGRIGAAVRTFEDLAACLDRFAVDVVHVCTPPSGHTPLVLFAVERGCHVLVEKPLAPTLGETEAILDSARRRGVRVNPVHQFPFQNGVRRLLARTSELGELVRIVYRTSSAGGLGRSPSERHALLAEILPHPVSLFHRFMPGFDPLQLEVLVQAEDLRVAGRHGTTYLEAFITLRGRPPCNELQITGTRASALADLFHGYSILDRGAASGAGKLVRPFAFSGRQLVAATANGVQRAARLELAYPGLRELIHDFYASLATATAPPISDEEIVASAALAESAAAAPG
jgi:predicted dehydrogenase